MSTIDCSSLTLRAVSVGGLETCIEVPSWKLCFDIGRCPPTAMAARRVLFTHGHIDHMGGVATHLAMRDLYHMEPPEYWVPAEYVEPFHDLLTAWRRLDRADLPCEVRTVAPGDLVRIGSKRSIAVFRSVHRIPTCGYALLVDRSHLKPELVGRPGREIAALKKQGVAVEITEQVPELAFCGDTTIDVLEREDRVRTARVLVLECTFLDDRMAADVARKTGHTHLDDIIEAAHLFENETIVLTHFSRRYRSQDIQSILAERLPASLAERVVPLLPEAPWTKG